MSYLYLKVIPLQEMRKEMFTWKVEYLSKQGEINFIAATFYSSLFLPCKAACKFSSGQFYTKYG